MLESILQFFGVLVIILAYMAFALVLIGGKVVSKDKIREYLKKDDDA